MIVLALDLGVLTGWALSLDGKTVTESGVQEFALKRSESGGMRYLRFSRWLEEIDPNTFSTYPRPFLCCYELPHHRGGYTTEVHNGLATHVQGYCARHELQDYNYQAVHTATIKKFTTGSGRADKRAMAEAALRRWPTEVHQPLDDNQVDAVALLHYALAELVPHDALAERLDRP